MIYKNKKGFTLIELLAVIVVLAIVMMLATTSVLPLMNNMKKSAFADEATGAAEAASTLVTMVPFNAIDVSSIKSSGDYKEATNGSGIYKYCITLKGLGLLGLYSDKNPKKVTDANAEYVGKIVISTDIASTSYNYKIVMHNKEYAVNILKSAAEGTDVVVYKTSQNGFACTENDVSISSVELTKEAGW